jgi:hypothetical protein
VQFIIVWLLGDVFNIIGAVMQGVLPTMVILAIYYTIADIVLLLQCFYYRGLTWRDEPAPAPAPKPSSAAAAALNGEPNERTDLLTGTTTTRNRDRRNSSDWSALSPAVSHIPDTPVPDTPPSRLQIVLWNATVVVMVCAAGVLGWFLGHRATGGGKGSGSGGEGGDSDTLTFNFIGQFFGYLCAVAYVASRLPQLVLNWRRKTTEGLSMLFFLFACLGNITYVLSIFAYDPKCHHHKDGSSGCEPGEAGRIYGRYILVNLSWLLGSSLTLILDLGVFAQYFVYNVEDSQAPRHGSDDDDDFPEDDQLAHAEHTDDRPLLQRNDSVYP